MFRKLKSLINNQGFITGAAILAAAGVICRLIGIMFRIPLANIVGNFGMGLYQMVFPLYALLLVVSSAGIPIAISKMIAKNAGVGVTPTSDEASNEQKHDKRPSEGVKAPTPECRRILFNAIVLLGFIGLVISALFFIFANQIASLQGNGGVGKIYYAIAPSVFLVCILAAFRGYFQGLGNMVPTATTQIVEQILKVTAGLILAISLAPIGIEWAVFGAILAVTISEIGALVLVIFIYLFHRRKLGKKNLDTNRDKEMAEEGVKSLLDFKLIWLILKKSAPITAMAAIFPLILVFDSMVVINMLEAGGASNRVATQLFGISSGTVHTLINTPAVLGAAIGTAVVPMVARLNKQGNKEEMKNKCILAIKLSFITSMFFVIFYLVFSREIIVLLYEKAFEGNAGQLRTATILLKIESIMILLMGLSIVFTAMLQGLDKAKYPLIALAIGGAVKIAFQLGTIMTPLGIYAVSIGNVLCFAIAFALNVFFVFKFINIRGRLTSEVWRPLVLAALNTGIILGLFFLMPSGKWWIILNGVIAMAAYLGLIWVLGIFRRSKSLST